MTQIQGQVVGGAVKSASRFKNKFLSLAIRAYFLWGQGKFIPFQGYNQSPTF